MGVLGPCFSNWRSPGDSFKRFFSSAHCVTSWTGQVCCLVRSQHNLLESEGFEALAKLGPKYFNHFVHTGNSADEGIALGYNFLDSVSVNCGVLSLSA